MSQIEGDENEDLNLITILRYERDLWVKLANSI